MRKSTAGIIILILTVSVYFGFRPLPDDPGLTIPETVAPFLNGNFPDISPVNQEYTIAFPNLTFNSPLTFTTVPNTGKLIIGQRNGELYWFENDDAVTAKNLLRDLSDEVGVVWDGGFLGLAVHPEFGEHTKNYIYVYYTTKDSQGRDYPDAFVSGFGCNREDYWGSFLILKRMTVDPNTLTVDPSEDLVMLKMRMFSSSHRGGGLVFGNDGFLYLATGDQSAYTKSQNNTNLDGGVLRMDVDQDPSKSHAPIKKLNINGRFPDEISGEGYWIPNDNPFLSADGSRFEEYYTIGHRNPHRMTKDMLTGDFYIGEIGEARHEEINVLKKGGNYGWPVYEGTYYRGTGCTDMLDGMPHEAPLTSFPRAEANAIMGGYVYRGTAMPSYYGKYICADYGIGEEIWAVDIATGTYETITQFSPTDIISFGEDTEGELYLLSQGDNVPLYRLMESGALQGTVPQRLSETGAFNDLQTLEPAQGLIPYELIESFWSDGAEKQRWLAIPNDGTHNTPEEQISFSENGDWEFPVGAVLVKHFELPIDENNPSLTKRLETRFSIKASNGSFYFVTYKWNAEQTEAFLLETGVEEAIAVTKTDGSTEYQTWAYPSTADCISCHNPETGGSLGTRTRYLNSELTYPTSGVRANQLVTLSHLGILNEPIDEGKTQGYQTHKAITDATASLDEKARSYLDLNCAYCHRPGATGERAQFDLQLFRSLSQTGLLNAGINTPLGIDGEQIIVPNDASKSILYHRMNSVDQTIAMPPIAKNKIDVAGVELIQAWINQLEESLPIPDQGEYRIVNSASGGTLQIPSAGTADRLNVAVGSYAILEQQHFAFEEAGNGYYQFRALHSDKYLDVELGGTVANTNVWQYIGNSTDAQLWELIDTGDDSFYIVSKLSGFYLGVEPDGNVAVLDDNSAAVRWQFLPIGNQSEHGITVLSTAITTSENEDTATLEISLRSAPTEDVTLLLSGTENTDEYTLSASELTFTAANWNVPQNVTVTGVDDTENDGTQFYTISIAVDDSRSDPSYSGFSLSITGENLDNDSSDGGECTGTLADVTEPVGSGTVTSRND
ncbi:PQQ-dependent sugar dehydrogenase, partial [Maribacter chungangensis]